MGSLLGKGSKDRPLLAEGIDDDRAKQLREIASDGTLLQDFEELQDDKEAVLIAVSQNGFALEHASERLQSDRDVALVAVSKIGAAPLALNFAAESVRNDRAIVSAAVEQDGAALEYASDMLRRDREIVRLAVTQTGYALEFACEELQNDKGIALIAVHQSGQALEFVSDELRGDREVVLAAVSGYGHALEYAAEALKWDDTLVRAAMDAEGGIILQHVPMDLAVSLARNPDVMQNHLHGCCVLIISMLSGQSCLYVAPAGWLRFKRDVLHFCIKEFGIPDMNLQMADLLLDGNSVPDREICSAWPGLRTGCATELQLVISQ